MRKHAQVTVTWSSDLGLSLVKHVQSFIPDSIFSEQRFYLRNFLSEDDHIVFPMSLLWGPWTTVLGLGSTGALWGLNPKLRITSCSGRCQPLRWLGHFSVPRAYLNALLKLWTGLVINSLEPCDSESKLTHNLSFAQGFGNIMSVY